MFRRASLLLLVSLLVASLTGCSGSVKIGASGKKAKKYNLVVALDTSGSAESLRKRYKDTILSVMDRLEGRLTAVYVYRFASGKP